MQAREKTEMEEIEEQFRLAQLAAKTNQKGGPITVDEVVDELHKQGVNVKENDDETIVIDDKHVYEIIQKDKEVEWENIGTVGKERPKIESIEVTNKTNGSITVKVETKRNEGGTLKYYIKEEDKEYTFDVEQAEGEHTFIIDPKKVYTHIKVEAIAENGEVTVKEIDLLNVPSLTEGNVRFIYKLNGYEISEKQWTQGPITVEAVVDKSLKGYTLQYTTEDPTIESNWKTYKTGVEFSEKGKLYVRLYDTSMKEAGGRYTKEITNIDKVTPEISNIETTATTNNITITSTITDTDSGVAKWYFSKDDGTTWEPTNGANETSYTFTNLTQNKAYNLKIKAIDKVGNEVVTETITKNTEKIPTLDLKENISLSPNENTPTNEKVTVTIKQPEDNNYTIQYTTVKDPQEGDWKTYKEPITKPDNGPIYTRLVDKTGQKGDPTIINVANIDRLPPIDFTDGTLTSTHKWTSITVKGDTRDQTKTETDGCSGIYGYRFKLEDGEWSEWKEGETCEYTFDGLTPHTEYTIQVETKDKAGNITTGEIKATTDDTDAPIIDKLEATSTTDSITLTATVIEEESGIAKCEFSIDGGVTWFVPDNPTDTSYTFNGLTQNKTYNPMIRVTDHSGNQSEPKSIAKKTESVPSLANNTQNIVITPDQKTPTSGNVTVTINQPVPEGYTIQYTTAKVPQESDWEEYKGPITMTTNGEVYARLVDKTGNAGEHATINIVNIDRLPPNNFTTSTLTATTTQNSITVTANTTDPKDENGYLGSGIAGYNFSIDGQNWTGWQTSGQYTFNNVSPGTYTIKVKAKDKAGNETEGTITRDVVTLSLSSSSGKVISGNSINVTVNGANYGTLSCSTANGSIATASLSGNTLTVRGTSATDGTQSTTITVTGSKGGSATYTIQSHKHYGNSTSGTGCWNKSNQGTRVCGRSLNGVSCGGTRTGVSCGGNITNVTASCGYGARCYGVGSFVTGSKEEGWSFEVNLICDKCNFHTTMTIGPYDNQEECQNRWQGIKGTYLTNLVCNGDAFITAFECTKCKSKYDTTGTCSKITSYRCNRCSQTNSSPGTCTNITSYTCPTHGRSYSSPGSCTADVVYTYYTMNCGF